MPWTTLAITPSPIDQSHSRHVIGNVGDTAGRVVVPIGDFNGDGHPDLAIGAPGASPLVSGTPVNDAGLIFVVFGTANGLPGPNFDLSTLDGSNGFRIRGSIASDSIGSALAGGGDVNGDGFDDIAFGHWRHNTGRGMVYILFGRAGTMPAELVAAALVSGTDGRRVGTSSTDAQRVGLAVAMLDHDGDGLADVAFSGQQTGGSVGTQQAVFFYRGVANGGNLSNGVNNPYGSNLARIEKTSTTDILGRVIYNLGDVNGDGREELGVAFGTDSNGNYLPHKLAVIYGRSGLTFGSHVDTDTMTSATGFNWSEISTGDLLGMAAANIGDFNGDGFPDLAAGAPGSDHNAMNNSGSVYVYFVPDPDLALPGTVSAGTFDGTQGVRIDGPTANLQFGYALTSLGDFTRDQRPDFAVGAIGNSVSGGEAWVLNGRPAGTTFAATWPLAGATAGEASAYVGSAGNQQLGRALAGGADFDADGRIDLVVGAPGESGGLTTGRGAAHVVTGPALPPLHCNGFETVATVCAGE